MTKTKNRTGVYLRVSTEEQREKQTIATQRAEVARYCELRGLDVVRVFEDDGVSGYLADLDERPSGKAFLASIRAREFDTVVIWKLDRVGRTALDILNFHKLVGDNHAEFVSIYENIDTRTPTGRLFLTQLSGFAEYEREGIRDRVIAGLRRVTNEQNRYLGGVPFGYRRTDGSTLEIVEDEAAIVREIFTSYAKGRSPRAIAVELNRRGIPTKENARWEAAGVRRFLHRETYAGRMRFGQQKKSAHKKSPPVVFNEVAVPAIIDADTWRLVQARLVEASNLTNRRARRQYLLTGLIRCAICQRRCTGHTKVAYPPHKREYRYYQCLSRFTDKYEWCRAGVCPADQLEQAVWGQVEGFIRNPKPVLRQLEERMGVVTTDQFNMAREQARIERSRNATTAERNKLVGAIAKGILSDTEAADQIEQIRLRLAALDKEEDRLAQSADTEATNKAKLGEVEAMLRALAASMDDIDFEGRRHIVRRLVKEIVLGRDEEDQPHAVITYAFSDPNKVLLIEMQEL